MQPKSFTLDGKRYRLDPVIPAGLISRMVASLHVGRSDSEVMDFLEPDPDKGWSPKLIRQARAYALACHRKNQALYRAVMRGGF